MLLAFILQSVSIVGGTSVKISNAIKIAVLGVKCVTRDTSVWRDYVFQNTNELA